MMPPMLSIGLLIEMADFVLVAAKVPISALVINATDPGNALIPSPQFAWPGAGIQSAPTGVALQMSPAAWTLPEAAMSAITTIQPGGI